MSDAAAAGAPRGDGALRLEPVQIWLRPTSGPLLPQLRQALITQAAPPAAAAQSRCREPARVEALRWAITAVDPERGLRLEGILLHEGG